MDINEARAAVAAQRDHTSRSAGSGFGLASNGFGDFLRLGDQEIRDRAADHGADDIQVVEA